MLTLEHIDHSLLHIESLKKEHLPEVQALWASQYLGIRKKYAYLPQTWLNKTSHFSQFIEQHIKENAGIVLTFRQTVIGFMVYDMFDFHGEKTAFFPISAHAVDPAYTLIAYSQMYRYLSQVLIEQGCLNHLVTFFSDDQTLQHYLFELGFGLYVVDAYRDLHDLSPGSAAADRTIIRQATREDLDELWPLVQESDAYYAEAPLFLTRESESKDELQSILLSPEHAVFIATADNSIIGFMNIRCHNENDVITLSDPATALIDPLGAYIRQAYRGRGIGKRLLQETIAWGKQQKITTIHVDFESANYHANQFWPKYFVPLLYSVRRHLNADAFSAH